MALILSDQDDIRRSHQLIDPFAAFGRGFGSGILSDFFGAAGRMHSLFEDLERNAMSGAGNGHCMVFSSQTSYDSSDPTKSYTRTTQTQMGPGGVLESRTSVRDGRTGEEKMGIRRQLGDRVAQIERVRNTTTGDEETRKIMHNVDDDAVDEFDKEWQRASQKSQFSRLRGDEVERLLPSQHHLSHLVLEDSPFIPRASAVPSSPTSPVIRQSETLSLSHPRHTTTHHHASEAKPAVTRVAPSVTNSQAIRVAPTVTNIHTRVAPSVTSLHYDPSAHHYRTTRPVPEVKSVRTQQGSTAYSTNLRVPESTHRVQVPTYSTSSSTRKL